MLILTYFIGRVACICSGGAYGALGTFFVLMFWIWITNFILLVAAEMDSEFDKAIGLFYARDDSPRALIAS